MTTPPSANSNDSSDAIRPAVDSWLAEAQRHLKAEVRETLTRLSSVPQGSPEHQDLVTKFEALTEKNKDINTLKDDLDNGVDPLLVLNEMGFNEIVSLAPDVQAQLSAAIQQKYPSIVGNKQNASLEELLSKLNDEGRLRDLDQGIKDQYNDLKAKFNDPALTQNEKIQIKQQMYDMKEQHPELKQLDRSTLGRNLHSGLRDAVQMADSLKDKVTQSAGSVKSHLSDGLKSLKQGVTSLSDRLKIMENKHELDKLDKKLGDLNQGADQLNQDKQAFERQVMMANVVSGPGSVDPARREQIVQDNLKQLLGQTQDLSVDDLNKMAQQKLADFDAKIKDVNVKADEIKAKVQKVTDQQNDLQNKKNTPQQSASQTVKQKV
ncbi:hypothetical protein SAMN02745166_02235 [Prosthecobacter debontii]|uniref:Uncharacterized protein n=1 Tax=Prosthecobacter debontii TaxID=48467 RepID=A0A1T4XZE8_9BACT|nr:hypothetical protein SAMN02745166_02235 [Prosthecobacter debontii]